jgi:hypothetical protein
MVPLANNVTFTLTRLSGTNKVGDLKKNERGYYTMIIGALNMYNSAGMYYRADAAKQFFEASSSFMRRVNRGALRGEYGHPRREPHMSMQAYYARLLSIHEDKVCCHFASVSLDYTNYKDDQGRPIVAIIAEVAPNGPLGHILEKQLQNPNENVCFSIRSFTDDKMERGVINRYIKTIVTFDYVNEPGMSIAEKYNSPALEGLEDTVFTRGQVESGTMHLMETTGVGNESVQLNLHELMSAFNWSMPATAKSASKRSGYSW